jgi:hypothetical protein
MVSDNGGLFVVHGHLGGCFVVLLRKEIKIVRPSGAELSPEGELLSLLVQRK